MRFAYAAGEPDPGSPAERHGAGSGGDGLVQHRSRHREKCGALISWANRRAEARRSEVRPTKPALWGGLQPAADFSPPSVLRRRSLSVSLFFASPSDVRPTKPVLAGSGKLPFRARLANQLACHLRRSEEVRHRPALGVARDMAGARDPDGGGRSGNDPGAPRQRGRGRGDLGGRAFRRRQIGHADAEPRIPRQRERHRLLCAALSHPAAHADQLSRPFRRARPVADTGRGRHRAGAARAGNPVRLPRQSRDRRKADRGSADMVVRQPPSRGAAADARADVGGAVTMQRLDWLRAVYDRLGGCLVVTIMGAVASELQSLGHRTNFFYLQHAMGLASSTGLGLALCLPGQRVVVFDGDGSVLMNLGGLTTLARYRPGNLVHVIFDNESLLSVGGFPTATATGSDIAGIAKAAGVPRTTTVRTVRDFAAAFEEALRANALTTLVAKVEATGPAGYVTDLSLLENRFEFRRHIQS